MAALMDLYADAAGELCSVLEQLAPARFERSIESADPDTASIRSICEHAVAAAYGYANYIRRARGLATPKLAETESQRVTAPADVRPLLGEALRYTEGALEGLYDATEEEVAALEFQVSWGPTYDPDMLLEHAILHLLRHRRQILRWPS